MKGNTGKRMTGASNRGGTVAASGTARIAGKRIGCRSWQRRGAMGGLQKMRGGRHNPMNQLGLAKGREITPACRAGKCPHYVKQITRKGDK